MAVVLRCGFSVVSEKRLEQEGLSVPGWRVHEYVDKTFFGKSYRKIHQRMDSAFVVLRRGHRVWFHDQLSAVVIARECFPDDSNAPYAALAHIQLDELCSNDPIFKMMLETMEMLDRKKSRRTREQALKMDDTVAKVLSDLKKIQEIKRLHRYFYSR